jgi:hypothetical protein
MQRGGEQYFGVRLRCGFGAAASMFRFSFVRVSDRFVRALFCASSVFRFGFGTVSIRFQFRYGSGHGPGCAFAEGRVLPTRRVGEASIRLERRAAKQNERPLQQAQRIVRLPGATATPAHSYTHPTPARQSWISAGRHIQSPPLPEMAFPLVCRSLYPGAFVPSGE